MLALTACASLDGPPPLLPPGYGGPTSTILDSVDAVDTTQAHLFFSQRIGGKIVETSKDTSLAQSRGQMSRLTPMTMSHRVASGEVTVEVVGENVFAMPILALTHSIFRVKGSVTFVASPDKTYVVKGAINDVACTVWIEEQGGPIVGNRIEITGAQAKVGFLSK